MIVWSNPAPGLTGAGHTNFATYQGGIQILDVYITPNDDLADAQPNGNPTFVFTPLTPSNSPPYLHNYSLFINGVLRTTNSRGGSPNGPGYKINRQLNSRDTLDFTTIDMAGAYVPSKDDAVLLYEDTTLLFDGYVDTVGPFNQLADTTLYATVHCIDVGVMFDRRVVGKAYNASTGGIVAIIAGDIVKNYLEGLGLGYTFTFPADVLVPGPTSDIAFYYVTCTEAFNQLAAIADANWRVDNRLVRFLQISDPEVANDGTLPAPCDFIQTTPPTTGNYITAQTSTTSVQFANRVWTKSNINLGATWTDEWPGNTAGVYPTTYGLIARPTVRVNGVDKIVKSSDELRLGPTTWDFYYIDHGIGVFYNPSDPPLTALDTVDILYPSPLPFVGMAQDPISIAAVGLFEKIVDAGDINDKDRLSALAVSELAKASEVPITLTVGTFISGFLPGQRYHATMTLPPVDSDFVATSVSGQLIGNQFMQWSVTGQSTNPQRQNDPSRYLGNIIARTRTPQDRVIERISFVVAGTIEGLTNPGLTTGTKTAIQIAQRPGTAGWASIRWSSVDDGTLTTTDIEIDILQNGVTIFGATKLVFPAGSLGTAYQYEFSVDSLQINAGDQFRFNIISADPLATDGTLELVTLG